MNPVLDVRNWVLQRLEPIADQQSVLVRDPLHLLPESDGILHSYAREHNFTVVVAATNLVFRDLYERSVADPETRKILVVDRAPAGRRGTSSIGKAPPPFYPDFAARTGPDACIVLHLRDFLIQATVDALWPAEANESRYSRLIVRNLEGVFRAHSNLRTAQKDRFTDHDFKTIVAY